MQKFFVLAASIIIQLALGSVYTWSTFAPYLTDGFGLTQAQAQLIFGTTIAIFSVSMIPAGRLLKRYGPRLIALIGGCLFGIGYLLASWSGGSFALLLVGIGIIAGTGLGFGYVCPITTCIRWFPTRKGLISGIAVAGFGSGAVLLSLLAANMFSTGKTVLEIFQWIGLWYGGTIAVASLFLTNPRGCETTVADTHGTSGNILLDRRFLALAVGMWAGTFGGLLVIGNLKPIGLAASVPVGYAAAAISGFAVGNGLGRLFWGALSDRLGARAIPSSLLFLAGAILLLLIRFPVSWMFVVTAFLTGFGFGACFVVYMTQTANEFGANRIAQVYPFVFLFYGFSGIAGPTIGGWLYDKTGTYTTAILIGAGVSILGAIGHMLLSSAQKIGKQEDQSGTLQTARQPR
ncbi:MAG: MFS transporter [Chitinivibrionales bacterium]